VKPLVVGFDLDMTLIDTRPGIAAVWDALAAETGVVIDSTDAVSRLGPPLDEEMERWFPAHRIAEMGDRFRAL
jgi:phosphoglycolate phosphatase